MRPADVSTGGSELFVAAFRQRIDPLLDAVGISPHDVEVTVEARGRDLLVVCRGPLPPPPVRQAMGVHVLGAAGSFGRTMGHIEVGFEPAGDPVASR